MSFSLPGLLVSVVILAPSLLLIAFPPRGAPATPPRIPAPLVVLERAGQAGCLVAPALTGLAPGSAWWLTGVAVSTAAYYGVWLRYFLSRRRYSALYSSIGALPVPLAVFPVLAFGFSAAWLHSVWLGLAAVILAVGHIGSSLRIAASARHSP